MKKMPVLAHARTVQPQSTPAVLPLDAARDLPLDSRCSRMKVSWILFVTGVLLAWALPGQAELVDAILKIVDDSVITYHDVQLLNQQTELTVKRQYSGQFDLLDQQLNKMAAENLETLVQRRLILREFKTAGYILPDSLLDELVQDSIRSDFGDKVKMTRTLEAEGLTYEKYRQEIKERFIIQQMTVKNVASEIIISPHKVEAYYLAHRNDYNVEDEAKLRVIVLRDSADTTISAARLADDILTQLNNGASFEQMATLYSQGSQRGQGGDWGWWERSKLTKGLADVAFSLPVGKHSSVFSRSSPTSDEYWVYEFETSQSTLGRHYGLDAASRQQVLLEERRFTSPATLTNLPPPAEYYLMLVEDRRTAHFRPLTEVREDIERNLLLEEQKRIRQQWIDRLKKKTFVQSF
jgi:peptidyl-prolyl cis-trans isomerase SurA